MQPPEGWPSATSPGALVMPGPAGGDFSEEGGNPTAGSAGSTMNLSSRGPQERRECSRGALGVRAVGVGKGARVAVRMRAWEIMGR